LHESGCGTSETSTDVRYAAAFGGKADICQRLPAAGACARIFAEPIANITTWPKRSERRGSRPILRPRKSRAHDKGAARYLALAIWKSSDTGNVTDSGNVTASLRSAGMGNQKYHSGNLIPMFRKAATLRNEMIAAGFTDNGGAIHSAERVLNLLAERIKYPGLGHINDFRKYEGAEFSVEALTAYKKGGQVLIEHVSPIRALTRRAIELVDRNATDDELVAFIKSHYQLVLLTSEETRRLNKQNRSKMAVDRLKDAGIQLAAVVHPARPRRATRQ
jgi:hypothetical protein